MTKPAPSDALSVHAESAAAAIQASADMLTEIPPPSSPFGRQLADRIGGLAAALDDKAAHLRQTMPGLP